MIAAILPCSFADYPGALAAVAFAQGCDLRCRYCHNPALCAAGPGALSADDALAFLRSRRGLLGGLVVSGGEPTLHADLERFLREARALGFRAKLDTNGMRPPVVDRLVAAGLVDFLAVDVKVAPGSSSLELCGADGQAESALETLRVAVDAGIPHEARTTAVAGYHGDASLGAIARALGEAGVRRWRLQPCESAHIPDASTGLTAPPVDVMERAAAYARRLGLDAAVRARENVKNRIYSP